MKHELDLDREISSKLALEARIMGLSQSKLLESLVNAYFKSSVSNATKYFSPKDKIDGLDKLGETFKTSPILSESAFDRETIYEDR
jgi:hypothetical protein